MRSLPQALQAHLDTGTTTLAWCWRITRRDGHTLGFTDHDQSLVFDNTTFEATTGFTATEIKTSAGFAVDNLEVQSALRSDTLDEADLAQGHFDNASIEIFRVNWQDTTQRVRLHVGSLGEIKRAGNGFLAEVRGLMHQLDQPTGRLYQHTCDASLGDNRCGIDVSDPTHSFTTTLSTIDAFTLSLPAPPTAYPEGHFDGGTLTLLPPTAAPLPLDIRRAILTAQSCSVELWQTPKLAIAPGTAVRLTAGCDKRFATCRDRYANALNFRGFPSIPGTDFVTAVATPGSVPKVGSST
jgi:uncharacterized phage protein (TIGR02218 family)